MMILGIETSCDETAAAVVEDGHKLLSNVVASSVELHKPFGGVVPEIAARSHIESIIPVIDAALEGAFGNSEVRIENSESKIRNSQFAIRNSSDLWSQIDVIAVTQGPGLLGSLAVGVSTAKTLAIAKKKPLMAVNHVQAHVYASFITEASSNFKNQTSNFKFAEKAPEFPLLALIVSGGHTQIVLFESHKKYKILGQTTDDAAGEAFDKVAKMLGLPYPGGPSIATVAKTGDPQKIKLPDVKLQNPYDFSFSGLKTATLRAAQSLSGVAHDFPSSKLPSALNKAQKADIAATFQQKSIDILVTALQKAVQEFQPNSIVVAGGVAASLALRKEISKRLKSAPTQSRGSDRSVGKVIYPDIKLCTDNAAMIAALAFHQKPVDPYPLEAQPSLTM